MVGISEEWMKKFGRLALLTPVDGIEMGLGIIKNEMAGAREIAWM